ncbi:MAG: PilZ domain-containing protein [Bdellovibrionota bacterium]
MNQRRNHYRIEYPLSERPLCIYNNKKLPVIDISEGGAQIEYSLSPLPRIGNLIKAKIVFDNRATVDIEAKVTRISGIKVALIFSKGWIYRL